MDPLIHNATDNDFHEAQVMGGILGTWLFIGVVVLMVFFITQCTDCCGGIAAVYKRRSSKKTQPEGGGKMYGNDLHRR